MSKTIEFTVPDIGDFSSVPVVEIHVAPGDTISIDDSVISLESDKATLDVPSTIAGRIVEVCVGEGDRVSQGSLIAIVEISAENAASDEARGTEKETAVETATAEPPDAAAAPASKPALATTTTAVADGRLAHASPGVRKLARELGVEIGSVSGSGPKGRITRDDLHAFVKSRLGGSAPSANAATGEGLDLLPWPKVDYEKFGETERVPLSRIARLSGPNLARNATIIPHVTNFEEADITELEAFRKSLNADSRDGLKLSILPFVAKAAAATLRLHPKFNSSLDGDALVLKKYFNIGVATDTPEGLVVPVVKAADQKGIIEIAAEMVELAAQARAGKLKPQDMQGATFTISSLGGIGGTNFTPIINAPEVAILGMTRARMQPVWNGEDFEPRLIQPLSMSWDHRAVDGVAAARFLVTLKDMLSDFRRITL
ncbi:dihydrolipoyllysine-residue acetyltransferase [Martelella mediterranea]|uniref:Dihydrolipoamide acetyltransferase component of pyruvate dehydrogenase complex n=1 Tax=Martelella mediterranea DSM 17316 TaxID=1122214 RepID=A0A1U9Z8N8_9HYPH|nr:dihydrolipoyllysine-residue acetyltransferase [Martelella mediterranea]AQZ53942.1 Dihydrolipoyllysine-residue acetyltransferase component of pyruvate dehydrogenase complex [Martelella mediterranea DSM 17316]